MASQREYVYQWMPVCPMDAGGIEEWLGKMAAQGLFLAKSVSPWSILSPILTTRVRFQREEPKPGRRYRLYPFQRFLRFFADPPSWELRDLYAASGWTYTVNCGPYFVFYTDDPQAPEPFDSTQDFRDALDNLYSYCILTAAGELLLLLIIAVCAPLLPSPGLSVFTVLFLLDMTELIVDLVNVRALSITRRRLRRGDPGRSRPLPRSLLLTARGAAAVFLAIIVTDLVLIGYALLTTRTSSLPLSEWDPDFPLLTLSEMEGDGSWTPEANYDFSFGIEDSPFADIETHFNQVDITRSPLFTDADSYYSINQEGSGTSGDSSMDILYYIFPDLSGAQEKLENWSEDLKEQGLAMAEVEGTGADHFSFRQEGQDWLVLARADGRALRLEYEGSLDLKNWFGEIADMLTQVELDR